MLGINDKGGKLHFDFQSTSGTDSLSSLPNPTVLSKENDDNSTLNNTKVGSIGTSSFVLPLTSNCRQNDKSKSRYFPHFENKRTEDEEEQEEGEKQCCLQRHYNTYSSTNSFETLHSTAPCGPRKRKCSNTQEESQQCKNNIEVFTQEISSNHINKAKMLKSSCDDSEIIFSTTNDKICCYNENKDGYESNENISQEAASRDNTEEQASTSDMKISHSNEHHPHLTTFFTKDDRVRIFNYNSFTIYNSKL